MVQQKAVRQDDAGRGEGHRIRFRFVAESRWILGSIHTSYRRLVDLLNDGPCEEMAVEEVVVQGDAYAYRAPEPSPAARLFPRRALLLVPVEGELAQADSRSDPPAPPPTLMRLGVGPYEVVGQVQLPEGASLVDSPARFLTVRGAVVRPMDGTGRMDHEAVVLVNLDYLAYLMPVPRLPLFDSVAPQVQLD